MTRGAKRLEWAIGLVALTAAAVLLSASASDRPEPQRPNLQGTWALNEDLTARMRQDDQAQGGPGELRASWDKDGFLTVEVKPDKGPKRTESYVVSNDGKHLYVTLILDRNGREVKIRRAYDPAPEEKSPAPEGDDDDRELYA